MSMCMCMHACVFACMCTCKYVHVSMSACMHVCVYTFESTRMYACTLAYIHTCTYIHTCVHACMLVCMYACMHCRRCFKKACGTQGLSRVTRAQKETPRDFFSRSCGPLGNRPFVAFDGVSLIVESDSTRPLQRHSDVENTQLLF